MDWEIALSGRLKQRLPDLTMERDVPMIRHTSLRVGGPAKLMVFPRTAGELEETVHTALALGIQPLIIGNGTNLLVSDRGLDALVVKTFDGMGHMERTGENEITAAAGVLLSRLAVFAWKNGLSGLEFAHGIPGTLGGAITMNAGAYGGEMKDAVIETRALDAEGKPFTVTGENHDFSYRHSVFSAGGRTVLGAKLRLVPADEGEIRARMDVLSAKRKSSQPLEYPSAGSAFKRPEGYFAAALIEQAGLKGTAVGGAQVSEKHAGFIINRGGATCDDVLRLIDLVRETVFRRYGVELEPEVKILGGQPDAGV